MIVGLSDRMKWAEKTKGFYGEALCTGNELTHTFNLLLKRHKRYSLSSFGCPEIVTGFGYRLDLFLDDFF
ncbi:hypothetical protein C5O19_03140 [Siphonobacter curvatus]|uniref:Uncharacterized protein n=1 Tax=Siphonobacter curvatus TaxID=2094562 RepID=A0A2S7ILP6_9BACT|nr:hypothetical protein C5O19_03140 [Siphonobacter curvatus]